MKARRGLETKVDAVAERERESESERSVREMGATPRRVMSCAWGVRCELGVSMT